MEKVCLWANPTGPEWAESVCCYTQTNLPNTHHIIASVWTRATRASRQCMWLTHFICKHAPVGSDGEFFSNLILIENIDLSKLRYCSGNVLTNFSNQTLSCCRIISITVVGFSPKRPRSCSELKLFFSSFII